MSENKKPRLAEVLGVEVGEKFDIDGRTFSPYMVTDKGFVIDREGEIDYEVVTYLLNDLSRLIRRPRWTEQEVEIAKAIKLLAPAMDYIERITENQSELYNKLDFGAAYLRIPCIPSMKVGERVALDDIIGAIPIHKFGKEKTRI